MKTNRTAQQFCESLPWVNEWKWFDKSGVIRMDDDRRVVATLTIRGGSGVPTHGHYIGFDIEIISKKNGVITSKFFGFNDYLPANERKDQRPDYQGKFEVIDYIDWSWYIAVPKDERKFTRAVEAYIEEWM